MQLIQHKIIELNQKLTPKVDENGEIEEIPQAKKDSIRDDILTLKSAAKILGLDV